MRVAIVGGPGIGKSTLVRQLADLYHNAAYGEGEEGVWDPRVLEDIDAGRNPVGVTAYFARLYDANYRDAAENDRPGKVIFFEGARITLEAHIAEYPAEYHAELRKVLTIGDGWNPDRVIVLNEGRVVAKGSLDDVLTPGICRQVFAVEAEVVSTSSGQPAFVFSKQAEVPRSLATERGGA